jgi:hypothetical protein
MGRVEKIEEQVRQLSPDEFAAFRSWFAEYDGELWDRQFEADVKAGKFDELAKRALLDHAEGQSTPL